MDLRRFITLKTVVEEGSFLRASQKLCCITALSTFVLPQTQALSWIIGVSVLLAMIGTFGNVCWALAGHLFQRLFRQYGRQLNIVLALLLVYCAVRIFY